MISRVIYIHPRRRFYVLEFSFSGILGETKVREAFKFPIKERGLNNANHSNHEREGWRRKDNHHSQRSDNPCRAVREARFGH